MPGSWQYSIRKNLPHSAFLPNLSGSAVSELRMSRRKNPRCVSVPKSFSLFLPILLSPSILLHLHILFNSLYPNIHLFLHAACLSLSVSPHIPFVLSTLLYNTFLCIVTTSTSVPSVPKISCLRISKLSFTNESGHRSCYRYTSTHHALTAPRHVSRSTSHTSQPIISSVPH